MEVTESQSENAQHRGIQTFLLSGPPAKLGRFAIDYSAGLRVRASPSLQAEETGRISTNENVAYIEEVPLTL